jgi:glycosyltransferase involved in cell wall biosynthesis
MKRLRRARRLSPEVAANLVALVDRHACPGLIIVRADSQTNAVARALVDTSVDTSRKAWAYICNAAHLGTGQLAELHGNYRRLLCQTPQSRDLLQKKLGISGEAKFLMLPPMIPACPGRPPLREGERAVRLCYSGKFSPHYFINETLDAFDALRREDASYEFHLIGDKFHNRPPVPHYEKILARRLRNTPGVVWHGGLPHTEAQQVIARCHVAASWRHEAFDDSLELSTKVLEYSALGLPVLMNPCKVQVDLFGEDYPLYVGSEEQFVDQLRRLSSNPELYAQVSGRVAEIARSFTYSRTLEKLLPAVLEDAGGGAEGRRSGVSFVG